MDAAKRRGYAYRNLGKYNETVGDFTAVINATPNDPEAYRRRGLAYRLAKNYGKAADDFRAVLRLEAR